MTITDELKSLIKDRIQYRIKNYKGEYRDSNSFELAASFFMEMRYCQDYIFYNLNTGIFGEVNNFMFDYAIKRLKNICKYNPDIAKLYEKFPLFTP